MASSSQRLTQEIRNLTKEVLNNNLHGRKLYLLGSAEFGPTNEPLLIKSTVGLYNKFGKEGTLINAFHAVKYISKDNKVYLVKTTGEHAIAYLNVNILDGEIIQNSFVIASSESNEIFNDVKLLIDIDKLTVIFPDDLNVPEKRIVYDFNKYYNIGLLAKAINNDTKNKKSYLNANYMVDPGTLTRDAFFCCNPDIVYLYGGQCGLDYTKDLLYNCLTKTYNILESHPVDIIIPVDAFLDDIYPDDSEEEQYAYGMKYYHPMKDYLTTDTNGNQRSFLNQLVNFCITQLNFGMVTTGIIGFNPTINWLTKYLYESDEIVEMYKACFEYNKALCENDDYSFLVSCVAGDVEYNGGTIIDNGYLAYGSFNASIQINIGNTNIPINNTLFLYNEFSEEVLKELADTGMVTFRHSPLHNTVVVYDGITATSRKESPLRLYWNVRMIQMCISYLNQLFQFFIGHNLSSLMNKKRIENAVNEVLNILVARNVITDFDFDLTPDYTKGTLTVNLNLLTNYMTEALNIKSVIDINSEEE